MRAARSCGNFYTSVGCPAVLTEERLQLCYSIVLLVSIDDHEMIGSGCQRPHRVRIPREHRFDYGFGSCRPDVNGELTMPVAIFSRRGVALILGHFGIG